MGVGVVRGRGLFLCSWTVGIHQEPRRLGPEALTWLTRLLEHALPADPTPEEQEDEQEDEQEHEQHEHDHEQDDVQDEQHEQEHGSRNTSSTPIAYII